MKNFIKMLIPSMVGSGLTIAIFLLTGIHKNEAPALAGGAQALPVHKTNYTVNENGEAIALDFTGVSKEVMNSVVHIKSTRKVAAGRSFNFNDQGTMGDMFGDDFFRHFFGDPPSRNQGRSMPETYDQVGTGSGVIISSDGYIITNNHVVDQADEIEVTLHNNGSFKAKVVATDPSTDLALLQIKEKDLQAVAIGNSDKVEIGEWVLAVGNPFNLNSTVTAGIVSAKGRNINIIDDKSAIEAFIQTDAAINPGNSGGALVNLNGELIGINTAIASPTGSYTGYGFAIPANIVRKVVEDFMKYGVVQRAYLGVMIRDINGEMVKDKDLKISEGVYVDSLVARSAAGSAGLKTGDVIIRVEDAPIQRSADLLEQIGRHRPGDKVNVTVNRKGKEMAYEVTLANQKGTDQLITSNDKDILDVLGATFETLGKDQARKLGIDGGVVISKLSGGVLKDQTRIQEGFIITGINNQKISTVEELEKALKNEKGGVMLQGIYENYPGELYYAFGLPE